MSARQYFENYCLIPSGPNSVLENLPLHLEALDINL
jgi:hypothetical protein